MTFFFNFFSKPLQRLSFLALFFCPVLVPGQKHKIDSLQKLVNTDTQDTSRIRHMNQLCWALVHTGQYGQGIKNANAAIVLGRKINFEKGLADSYNMLGNAYLGQGDLRNAEENFSASMEIQKLRGDKKGMAAAYNNLGLVYDYNGDLGKALESYAKALKLNIETGNRNWQANNYNNIGNNYNAQKKWDEALENFNAAKKIKEELGETNDYQYANIIGNIGNVYFYEKKFDKTLEFCNSAVIIRKEIGDEKGISDAQIIIGSVYFEQAKAERNAAKAAELYNKAEESMNAGIRVKEAIGDLYGLSWGLLDLGSLHAKQDKNEKAITELQRAAAISTENRMNDISKEVYLALAACDSALGNWKGAYEHQKLYKQFNDSMFNEVNLKKIAEMNTRFETEKKQAQIGQLEKEKKLTWLFVGIFAVLVCVVLYFARRAYKNEKKVAVFMASESSRKELLLQEVHHRINNNLQIISSLLSLQANSAKDERLYEYLTQSQNRIQSLSALHELLYQTDSPLKINMRDYLEKVLDFHRDVLSTLKGKVDLRLDVTDEKFATKLAVPIALIVNELVTNSAKYAFNDGNGGYLQVALQMQEGPAGTWMLRVSDSGKGLPEENGFRKDSLGLRLVKIMTKQMKGTLVTKNTPGATFEITFTESATD